MIRIVMGAALAASSYAWGADAVFIRFRAVVGNEELKCGRKYSGIGTTKSTITHLSVTIFIAYTEALHLALAPQRPYAAFLVVYSSMKTEDLQKELQKVQARFQSATKLHLSPGGKAAPTNWVWPDAKQVQALLQQRVMQAMVDPNGHSHEAPLEVHADVNASQEIKSVRIQSPDEFLKVLVVAFRPNQLWVERKSLSPEIKF
jgi:hypothetical protein